MSDHDYPTEKIPTITELYCQIDSLKVQLEQATAALEPEQLQAMRHNLEVLDRVKSERDESRQQLAQEKEHHEFYRNKVSEYMGVNQALNEKLTQAQAELEDLREFKREIDGDGLVPATHVQLLAESESTNATLHEQVEKLREALEEISGHLFTPQDMSRCRDLASASIAAAPAPPSTQPKGGSAVGGDFYNGIEWFACWLLDHMEGETITEEQLRPWAAAAWSEHLKRQNSSPAAPTPEEVPTPPGEFEKWIESEEAARFAGKHIAYLPGTGVIASADTLHALSEVISNDPYKNEMILDFVHRNILTAARAEIARTKPKEQA